MKCESLILEQINRICEMGREATEAVSRVLLRIDLLETDGKRIYEYLIEIDELRQDNTCTDPKRYVLHPSLCMCAAYVRLAEINHNSCDVWLDEMFISLDKIAAQDQANEKTL
jgi:hypothetical protein